MDSNSVNRNDYYEIISVFAPYCGSYWCGFDYETIKKITKPHGYVFQQTNIC